MLNFRPSIVVLAIAFGVMAITTSIQAGDTKASANYKKNKILQPGRTIVDCVPSTYFNGINDQLVLKNELLAQAAEFTVEAIIYPLNAFKTSPQPRFVHLESPTDPSHRLTMELRITDNRTWYFDTFISSPKGELVLIDSSKTHPVDQWHHIAISYKKRRLTSYIDYSVELQGDTAFKPFTEPQWVSVGARLNQVYWFNGYIHRIEVTPKALSSRDFKLSIPHC
ncbi:LamG-like jellyroll fold domain-containing protein [Halioxenophilus aromaticivorans]|uniref:Laminin G domain-containing protein n=1 Tax=Halioxenophilus aromaticivorans TaxID=1306992 RepID=A0AAV3U7J4_9ALTE